ncbi:hypothetical protein GCM10025866_30920 [Naasia aerilata]|uniref:Uncharacterized protein n=1 Tax=Naasia aerilata TaxID=1162966 RepID=A0ABM8GFR3_9MICO|nr:hypothetical protein GCM10025866_30920 [Naasia aerilata]
MHSGTDGLEIAVEVFDLRDKPASLPGEGCHSPGEEHHEAQQCHERCVAEGCRSVRDSGQDDVRQEPEDPGEDHDSRGDADRRRVQPLLDGLPDLPVVSVDHPADRLPIEQIGRGRRCQRGHLPCKIILEVIPLVPG